MRVYQLIIILTIEVMFLSGCASLNSDFECKQGHQVKCKSVDEINELIDRGEFEKA